jgi:hypothetical protein
MNAAPTRHSNKRQRQGAQEDPTFFCCPIASEVPRLFCYCYKYMYNVANNFMQENLMTIQIIPAYSCNCNDIIPVMLIYNFFQ